jgi:hypothetical protein
VIKDKYAGTRKKEIASREWCIMVAFDAGLSAHAYLLEK